MLALEAQAFLESVDPAVWYDSPELLDLWQILNAARMGGGGGDLGGHPLEPGMTDGIGSGAGESGACSFSATTVVTTSHGKQPISELHDGEKVFAYNPKTHKMEFQPIIHVWVHPDNDLIDLTLTTLHSSAKKGASPTQEVVHTNKKHPFLTVEQGFLAVSRITVGMHIRQADGAISLVTGWHLVSGVQTMYNLEVAQDHTFTVGVGQWIVHNCEVGGESLEGDPSSAEDSGPQWNPAFPSDPSKIGHIFRASEGHFPDDTPANRQLLIDTASNLDNLQGTDVYGTSWFAETLSDGTQSWVRMKGDVIINAGVNTTPRLNFDPQRGLIP